MADRSEFTGSAPRVADKVPPADQKFFHACNSYSPGTKVAPPRVETTPHGVEPPIPLDDFLLAGVHPQTRIYTIHLQLQHTGGENGCLPVYTVPHGGETPIPMAGCWLT